MGRYCYLNFVDPYGNHNKFYEMQENDDKSIDVTYGRIGTAPTRHHYAPYERNYDTLYREKIRKGYDDKTRYHATYQECSNASGNVVRYKDMEDKEVQKMMEYLLSEARGIVSKHYVNNGIGVTKDGLYTAKELLNDLRDCFNKDSPMWRAKDILQELYAVSERKMADVGSALYIATASKDSLYRTIQKEEDLLDKLEITLKANEIQKTIHSDVSNKSIAEHFGIEIRSCTYAEEDEIRGLMKGQKDKSECLVSAYRVINKKTEEAYNKACKDMGITVTKPLFHGSGNQNWISIMSKGLIVNADKLGLATRCGKGLGNGLYFADDISKSLNYNHERLKLRYIGIYDVAIGNMYDTNGVYIGHNTRGGERFGFKDLPSGCQSTFLDGKKCGGGHLNEYCVYKAEQTNIRYLISCEDERHKDVRFSMRLSVPFKNLTENEHTMFATAELSDYAKKELGKLLTDASVTVDECTCAYHTDTERFSLFINGSEIKLKPDEQPRLFRDFKKSFFESDMDFTKHLEERSIEKEGEER